MIMASATSSLFPAIRVLPSTSSNYSLEAIPRQTLEYDRNGERTSFFVFKDPVKGVKQLETARGDFKKQNYKDPNLLLGLHFPSSGYVYLESLHPTQKIYFTRERDGASLFGGSPPKRLLPRSKAPRERTLMVLDCDSNIFIDGEVIEFHIGSLDFVSERPSPWSSPKPLATDGDTPMSHDGEDDDPQILVQQSYPQEPPRRESARLTPVPRGTEPGVQETPSVKSRFMNPDSATVTLPRPHPPPREDTFGSVDEPTPRGDKSTAKLFASSAFSGRRIFGGHDNGGPSETMASQLPTMGDDTGGFDSVESTADEEVPEASRGVRFSASHKFQSTVSTVILPERPDGAEENHESGAEDMRRQFSEAPMITSFVAESVNSGKEASPTMEEEEEEEVGDRKRKNFVTPVKPMKQGVPEGFLYEEHKKDVTPRQTYGKNRRTARAKPKEKKADMDKRIERAINEDDGLRRGRSEKKVKGTQETDESEEEQEISPRRSGRNIHTNEEGGATIEEEEEEEVVPPPARTQGRRGRMTVQSQPDSTAAVVEVEPGSGRPSRRKRVPSPEQESEVPDVGEKEVKPTRPRRGAGRLSDTTAPATTKLTRSTKKRQRTPEDADEGQESLVGEFNRHPTRSGTEESVIHVSGEPKPKRAKTTPPKKPAAKTPASKRGRRKGVTPTPAPDDGEGLLGDTQYTFLDVTQTQPMDRVEVKVPIRTPKKTPKTAKKKTAPPAKRTSTTPSTRNKKEPTEEEEEGEGPEDEEVDGDKARTKDRYEGDSPKIVFSNSGLDERKDIEKFLRANGGKKLQNVSAPGVNFLVVGPGELKRTPKLIVAVALGKWVVEDQWLIDSKEIGYLLDPDSYIPHDPVRENAWSFSLRAAIGRGRNGENNILKDHAIYITPALLTQLKASKQEEGLVEMLKTTGAGSITKKAPKGKREDDENGDKTLVLGTEKGDNDVAGLEKLGWNVYGTGIVAVSVLRGRLEVGEEEFRIVPEKEGSQTLGRGRKGR